MVVWFIILEFKYWSCLDIYVFLDMMIVVFVGKKRLGNENIELYVFVFFVGCEGMWLLVLGVKSYICLVILVI